MGEKLGALAIKLVNRKEHMTVSPPVAVNYRVTTTVRDNKA